MLIPARATGLACMFQTSRVWNLVVSSTAAATLGQLVMFVVGKVEVQGDIEYTYLPDGPQKPSAPLRVTLSLFSRICVCS